MKEYEQIIQLDNIGRKLVDAAIKKLEIPYNQNVMDLAEQMDLILKSGEILKILYWLEENSRYDG